MHSRERPLKNVISKFICFCIDSHVPKISSWKCLDSEKSARTESMVQSSTKFGGISQAIKLKINIIEPFFCIYFYNIMIKNILRNHINRRWSLSKLVNSASIFEKWLLIMIEISGFIIWEQNSEYVSLLMAWYKNSLS